MPLLKLPKYNMSYGETTSVAGRIHSVVAKYELGDSHLSELKEDLQSSLSAIDSYLYSDRGASLSAEVREIGHSG